MIETVVRRRPKNSGTDFNLGVICGHRSIHKGEVGIEVEVEGTNLRKTKLPSPWTYHQDGSLRGEDNAEYVFGTPQTFDASFTALDDLYEMFRTAKSVLDDSNRTSVHVHLNVQNFWMNRLAAFLGMYFTLEEVLTEWCGEHRVGNLFCLRAKDAPAIISQIAKYIERNGEYNLSANIHHYAALNASAIPKLGSVEIRTLRGCHDASTIKEWLTILRRLYELSKDYADNPIQLIDGKFSGEGPLAFFEDILGPSAQVVRRDVPWTEERIRESLYEGMRMSQDIVYARDWSTYQPKEYIPDPFGRKPAKKARAYLDIEQMIVQTQTFNTVSQAVPPNGPMPIQAEPEPDIQNIASEWWGPDEGLGEDD